MELENIKIILKIRTGSHLYGTNTEDSDEDYAGIFLPPPDYLLGLKRVEEIDLSMKDKLPNGKNSPNAIDFKVYSLQKFAKLALDNNPNILEMLFVNEGIEYIHPVGRQLLDLRHAFLSKKIKHRFLGYAISQKHKMVIKLDNYEKLLEADRILSNCQDEKFLLELLPNPLFAKRRDVIRIADINVPATATVKRARKIIGQRLAKFGSRKELVSKYGFDTKFASHLIRLLLEGKELLSTGNLILPLQYADLIKDIRYGKYDLNKLLELSEELEKDIEELYNSSELPNRPNYTIVEQFVIDVHLSHVKGGVKDAK